MNVRLDVAERNCRKRDGDQADAEAESGGSRASDAQARLAWAPRRVRGVKRNKRPWSQKQRHHTRRSSRGRRTAWVPAHSHKPLGRARCRSVPGRNRWRQDRPGGPGARLGAPTPGAWGGSLLTELDPAVTTLSSRAKDSNQKVRVRVLQQDLAEPNKRTHTKEEEKSDREERLGPASGRKHVS